jgi:hypothetical protein
MPFTTHDFCGITIYECPRCKFDSEHEVEVKKHVWQRHELPRLQQEEAALRREVEAELYDAGGARVEHIELSENHQQEN